MHIKTRTSLKVLFAISEQLSSLPLNRPPSKLKLLIISTCLIYGFAEFVLLIKSELSIYFFLEVLLFSLSIHANILDLISNTIRPSNWIKFLGLIEEIDGALANRNLLNNKKHHRVFTLETTIYFVLITPYLIYYIQQYKAIIALAKCLSFLMMFTSVVLMYNLALILRHRFGVIEANRLDFYLRIKIYDKLCDAVETFNDIFGMRILTIYVYALAVIIKSINVGINSYMEGAGMSLERFLRRVLISFIFSIGFVLMVTVSCCMAERKAKRMSWVCYALMKKHRAINYPADKNWMDEVMLLARLVKYRSARFSALGFFQINCGTLLSLLGSVTTYLIIILQIKSRYSIR